MFNGLPIYNFSGKKDAGVRKGWQERDPLSPKSLLEKLGLKEGDMVQYIVKDNNLIVIKISKPLKFASEFNIHFDAKKAIKMIDEARKESEREIEHETLEVLKKG